MPGSFLVLLLLLLPVPGHAADMSPVVEGILTAWEKADCVCLGERHGSFQDSELRLALVRHPNFPRTVDVIVIEFATPLHQDLLDSYLLEGTSLSDLALSRVWRDALSPDTWSSPVYLAFFKAMREVNLALKPGERIRVIAADAFIDWENIHTPEELEPHLNRGEAMRETVAREVLDKNLKALALFGTLHCMKLGMGFPGELEPAYPGRFWTVERFFRSAGKQRGRELWDLGSRPTYKVVRGTDEAKLPATGMFFLGQLDDATPIGAVVDAFVYLGDEADRIVPASGALGWDAAYREELRRRRRLILGEN